MIPVIEWLQTCNLDHTATGIGFFLRYTKEFWIESFIHFEDLVLYQFTNLTLYYARISLAGGETRKLGCIGQEVRYGLEASDFSQSVNYPHFRLFVHLSFLLAQNIIIYCVNYFQFFRTKRIVPLQCSKLWMIIKHVRIQMVKYLTAIRTNNTE